MGLYRVDQKEYHYFLRKWGILFGPPCMTVEYKGGWGQKAHFWPFDKKNNYFF